jgi:hypothetical protein
LKDRGFQSNLSVLILPCGASWKEGENGVGKGCKNEENAGQCGYLGNLSIAAYLYF